ncbi:MAG: DUF3226 domain-containing protein [Desulfococcaceae bacterium]
MQTQHAQKILLVEGIDDQKVVEKLLKRRKIVFDSFAVNNCEGVQKLLNLLPAAIRVGSYEVLGLIVDADEDISDRWKNVRKILSDAGYDNIPANPDPKGIIVEDEDEELPKIGIWIMPDNRMKGRIEDFIRFLVPENDDLLPIAEKKVNRLIAAGKNRFSLSYKSKAVIHTWLAWQERPGKQIGSAVTYRLETKEYILDDKKAEDFVSWLKKVFSP